MKTQKNLRDRLSVKPGSGLHSTTDDIYTLDLSLFIFSFYLLVPKITTQHKYLEISIFGCLQSFDMD